MKIFLAALTLLVTLSSGVGALPDSFPQRGWIAQPDGTILHYVYQGDKRFVDGYVVFPGSGGWWYYAELDVRGEYMASPYKVGIDDPAEIGIPRDLQRQRSPVRQAEIDAANIQIYGTGHPLKQPDGTEFFAYWDAPLPTGSFDWCTAAVPADGYVISIGYDHKPLINYGAGHPFWAFVYDDESGWYYYAERNEYGNYVFDAQDEYVASPYKVGIDPPPYYDRTTDAIEPPPTAVQQRSWGGLKNLFHR